MTTYNCCKLALTQEENTYEMISLYNDPNPLNYLPEGWTYVTEAGITFRIVVNPATIRWLRLDNAVLNETGIPQYLVGEFVYYNEAK